MADSWTIAAIEEGFKKLQSSGECSLLKKHFSKDLKDRLKGLKTNNGATLLDVIRSGVTNLNSVVGVCAPDGESYVVFKDLFDPIIKDYHGGFEKTHVQPAENFGPYPTDLGDLDPEQKFVTSTRIRIARSFLDYPFNPCLSLSKYLEIERKVRDLFLPITDPDLQGTYATSAKIPQNVENQLINGKFLFAKEPDRFLKATNGCRYWPSGRGIFYNKNFTFFAWANEEDHLRIFSVQDGGNVGEVLDRLVKGLNLVDPRRALFSRDDRLGYLTFGPTNLGTTVRASVHIKLPKISARSDFSKLCDSMKLQLRPLAGGVYDISNKARLGLTEYEAVKQMYDGVKELIRMEKAEGAGSDLHDPQCQLKYDGATGTHG